MLVAPHGETVNLAPLLLGVWLAGLAVILGLHLLRWSRLRATMAQAHDLPGSAPIQIKTSDTSMEPGLVGILQPAVLMPAGLMAHLSDAERDSILAHEISHLRRRDNVTAAIHTTVEALFWFYPPVWLISRTPIADDVIGGFRIPAGSMVLLSSFVSHRHPALWDDPEGFDPDRFSPERSAERPRHAWLPFSGGPRKCIGDYFGLMEMQIVLSMISQRFRGRGSGSPCAQSGGRSSCCCSSRSSSSSSSGSSSGRSGCSGDGSASGSENSGAGFSGSGSGAGCPASRR